VYEAVAGHAHRLQLIITHINTTATGNLKSGYQHGIPGHLREELQSFYHRIASACGQGKQH
jgi:hypothetical protein